VCQGFVELPSSESVLKNAYKYFLVGVDYLNGGIVESGKIITE